ncbi:fimbrial protein [Fulvimonas yonginensis]|uniref:Fimbrial protein n=1 Tax=Fulvimonas yonginensis TaxID=1495200 RepID=A0ABU8J7G6_9GAMM
MYASLRHRATRLSPSGSRRSRGAALRLAAVLALLAAPLLAHADCRFDKINGNNSGNGNRYTSSPVNFAVAGTITVPFDYAYGTVLGSPVSAQPTNPPDATCDPGTQYGVENLFAGTATGSPSYIYPTNVPGVGYQLIHNDAPNAYMSPYPQNTTSGGSSTYNVGSTLQFVQTGPIANGATIPAGTIANWRWGSIVPEYFVLTNSVTFLAPACKVTTQAIAVTLPTVTTGSFAGKDSTTGATPFSIQLTCPSGSSATLKIQLDAQAGTAPGYTTVLVNQGTAGGIGVELKDRNGIPVTYGQAATVGTTVAGSMTLPYTAQYHATASMVTGGTVKATATFTLSYQ